MDERKTMEDSSDGPPRERRTLPGRSQARRVAVQLLYQAEYNNGNLTAPVVLLAETPQRAMKEGARIAAQVRACLEEVDGLIAEHSSNWRLDRIASVDLNVMRVGTYELVKAKGIPPRVAISEAVDMAREFGDEQSPRFVNGVLDGVFHSHITKMERCGDGQ